MSGRSSDHGRRCDDPGRGGGASGETFLLEAVKLMARRRISGMPVVDASGVIGRHAQRGRPRTLARGLHPAGGALARHAGRWLRAGTRLPGWHPPQRHKVQTVMGKGVDTVTEDTQARDIAHLMCTHNIKRVPVMRDGKVVGIVARSDLVRALADKLAGSSLVQRHRRIR